MACKGIPEGWILSALVSFLSLQVGADGDRAAPLLGLHERSYSGRMRLRSVNLVEAKGKEKQTLLEYETRYFGQILDHFTYTPRSYRVFQQKYLINDKHWGGAESRAPIFAYTGNEGDIEWFANNTGFMFEIAPRLQALLVFIEHRFYGNSMPFGDKINSYKSKETLGYLNSQQALADYATLILDLKKNLSAQASPTIVFGGSYGGSEPGLHP